MSSPSSSPAPGQDMALETMDEQRMRELSLEDPSPCLDTLSAVDRNVPSSSSSMDEIWQNIQHCSSNFPPSQHANSPSATLTLSRDNVPSHFLLHKDGAPLRTTLRRARQHLNAFELVKTLEFLIEETPASAPEIQHYQEALGVQQRKRQLLKRQKSFTGPLLRQSQHGRGSKMCHYKAILAEAAVEQVKKELEGGIASASSDI